MLTDHISYLRRIRGVDLFPGETVAAILHTERGLLPEPPAEGRLLVATNRRLISHQPGGGPEPATMMMFPADTLSGVSVRGGGRRGRPWLQWLALAAGGVAVYLLLAYWLVDRLPEVAVLPIINMRLVALLLMLLLALAGVLLWRSARQSGRPRIEFAGANWTMDASCAAAESDLTAFANTLLAIRLAMRENSRGWDQDGADITAYSGRPKGSAGSTSSDRSATSPRAY